MPRPFTTVEKERIRNLLLEKGKELFSQYGLKKTGVAELAKAVGIAQGSFYLFFESKEELYFRVLEAEEEKIRRKFIESLADGKKMNREKFKVFLHNALEVFNENPLIRRLWVEKEVETLLERLSREMLDQHTSRDTDALAPLIIHWQNEGIMLDEPAEVLAGVIRSLFFLPLHKNEIGEDIFARIVDLYVEFIADGLIKEGKS